MATTGAVTNVTGGFYTNTNGTATGDSNANTKAADSSGLDKDSFLKLMVAQLKYQSPDSPVDTNQFMAQTASMTQVETLQNMQKAQTTQLVADQSTLATGMIGKSITATNALGGADITGTVTGVRLAADGPVLKLGNTEVALTAVTNVDALKTS